MARQKGQRRRPELRRVGTLRGVTQRAAIRRATHKTEVPKGSSGTQYNRPPGSMNPRKVGR